MTGIIVLEGPDCTGKSTLAKAIVEKFNGTYIHATWSKDLDRVMWEYHLELVDRAVRESKDRVVVIDRLWLSEAIYGRIYRGGSKIPHEGRMLDRILRAYGTLNIVCLPQTPLHGAQAIADSAKKRDEMWEKEGFGKSLALCNCFEAYMFGGQYKTETYADTFVHSGALKLRDDTIRYSICDHGSANGMLFMLDFVEVKLNQLRTRVAGFDPYRPNVVGSPTASHIVCGDALNPKDALTKWPFCEYGNASLWLAESMHRANIDESKVIFTNVNDDDGAAALALIDLDLSRRVVCLGTKAAVTLSKRGITNFKQIPHPQWDRRFNRNGTKSYAEALAEVLPTS
jgi:nicotinamide riboside kinase